MNRIQKRFDKFLNIILVVFSVALFSVSAVLLYQKQYLTPIYINGQSMYPTLNYDTCDGNGNLYGQSGGGFHNDVVYKVEYGVMDTHKTAINSVKRFDIVVCDFPDNNSYDLIKRVIAMPGETFRFVTTGENKGDIEVKQSNGEFKLYKTPVEKHEYIENYTYGSVERTLGSDEYFVCGDNRGNSHDSRAMGACKKADIQGKVIAMCGTCEAYISGYDKNSRAIYDYRNVKYYSWPRFL